MSDRRWFLAIANKPEGPFDDGEVAERARRGEIDLHTLAWRQGMSDWRQLGETELGGPGAELRGAGFWRRAVASGIDLLLVMTVSTAVTVFLALGIGLWYAGDHFVLGLIAHGMHSASPIVAVLVYFFYFGAVQGLLGETVGKHVCGLRLARADGRPVGTARALLRSVAWIFSAIALGSGHVVAALNPRKRAWHDIVAGTIVLDQRNKPGAEISSIASLKNPETSPQTTQTRTAA